MDSLGLSITLSEVVETIAKAVKEPYEVISTEDMLNRVEKCKKILDKMRKEKDLSLKSSTSEDGVECSNKNILNDKSIKPNDDKSWDWRDELLLLGTDVTALFPSLSAKNAAKALRSQLEKSNIEWRNIDCPWLTLYLKLNDHTLENNDLNKRRKFLPERINKMGRSPSFGSQNIEKKLKWPQNVDLI